jgi:hypothetical protein
MDELKTSKMRKNYRLFLGIVKAKANTMMAPRKRIRRLRSSNSDDCEFSSLAPSR